jgi:hypothetical protein
MRGFFLGGRSVNVKKHQLSETARLTPFFSFSLLTFGSTGKQKAPTLSHQGFL